MNENSKTLTYVGVAVVLLGLGIWRTMPVNETNLMTAELGKEFFPDFTDPLKVASAEIIGFDAVNDAKHDLKVARVDDVWEINPKRQGYPEVSADRLGEVVKAVIGVKKLSVVSDLPEKHREFSVVDPGSEAELKEGTDGVGKRVTLVDAESHKLVDLIIGKKDEKNPKIVYVREPDRNRVYATELDTAPLSTSFGDWVQPDLLKVGLADLRKVDIHDYAIDMKTVRQQLGPGGPVVLGSRPGVVERAVFDAKKDDTDKWQVTKFETFDAESKAFKKKEIAQDEEIDATQLDGLKRSLAGLKIVDVKKKPKTLIDDLSKQLDFLSDPKSAAAGDDEAMMSLRRSGFWISPKSQKGELELVPEEGELKVGFENGLQYQLRFGGIVRNEGGAVSEKKEGEAPKADAKPAEGAAEGENTAPNRYLMVMASFNQDLIPKPPLVTLPPEGAAPAPAATAPATPAAPTAPATPVPAGTTPAPTATPAATPAATPKATPSASAPAATPAASPSATPAAKPAEATSSGSEGCETPSDPCQAEAPKTDAPKPPATPTATPSATPTATAPAAATSPATAAAPAGDAGPSTPDALKNIADKLSQSVEAVTKPVEPPKPMTPEERKRIEAENKRMQDKYDADVKAGREKAIELNKQFAEWYYVVDDATFRSLDLSPTSIPKKKSAVPPGNPDPHGAQGLPPDFMRQMQQRMQQPPR